MQVQTNILDAIPMQGLPDSLNFFAEKDIINEYHSEYPRDTAVKKATTFLYYSKTIAQYPR